MDEVKENQNEIKRLVKKNLDDLNKSQDVAENNIYEKFTKT